MKELFEQTNAEVKKATALIGKMQEPQYMVSPTWSDWADVKLKTPATMNQFIGNIEKGTLST